ncbi:hypothetical protein NEFER03_0291 [Nematocida sp. LUAm3]|nr:hypothetical protein NEFER03_0291 [Nematocida sp. LUAm3]KAI5173743.1 hypothetical protein NEFER02_0259 [Nematocida sp. LUAm2]KAI5176966.1 hypothetical protein NEFER01_0291 [Nematocida sp. LUAm1]
MLALEALATLLRQCKIPRSTGLLLGTVSQTEIKTARAKEILHGVLKQNKQEDLDKIMRIEMAFIKSRERFLKQKKTKPSLLNRAIFLSKTSNFDEKYVRYIEMRKEIFTLSSTGRYEEEKEVSKKINALLSTESQKVTSTLSLEVVTDEKVEYTFNGIDLSFPTKECFSLFKEEKYKELLKCLKNNEHFDSILICAVSKIEAFRQGLIEIKQKKGKGRVERYCRSWNTLYQKTLELFSSNFISVDYLKEVDEEVPSLSFSVPLHPITYDISSTYLYRAEASEASPLLTEIFQKMNIFRR